MTRAQMARRDRLAAKREYLIVCDQVKRNKERLIERLNRNLLVVPNPKLGTPCRLWQASKQANGYGRITFNFKGVWQQLRVHRFFMVLMLKRPIRAGYEVGHLCHVRNCVAHVEEMTREQNLRMRDDQEENCPF